MAAICFAGIIKEKRKGMPMAEKKEKRQYTNSLAGQSKDEIICSFAYSLATASAMSPKSETRSALLQLWRKSDITDAGYSEKQLRRYKSRALIHDESFSRLASLLKEAATDRVLLSGIASKVLMDLSACLERLFKEDNEIVSIGSMDAGKLAEAKGKINWNKVRRDWAPAVAYLRTFLSEEEYLADIGKRGITVTGIYKELVEMILSKETDMRWFVNRSGLPDDKKRINQYNHPSDYFRLCMDEAFDRLTYMQERFMLACGSPEFDCFRGYAVACLEDDAAGMESGYDILITDEMGASPLNREKPEDDAFAPPEESYFDFWISKGCLKVAYEYSRIGIDIMAVCRAASLSRKDASSSVKEAFMYYEIMKGERVQFTSKRDKEAVSEIIARLWIGRAFEKELSRVLQQKQGGGKNENTSKLKKVAEEAKQKSDRLEAALSKEKSRAEAAEKKAGSGDKQLLAEIAALRKVIKEKDAALKERDEDIKDLKELFMADESAGEETVSKGSSIGEAEFMEFIRSHKVLVWGLREETERKYKALYPELSFVASDRRLTNQQLESYDVLIMATNYTSHGQFFAARDAAKRRGMPMAYLAKTDNSPEALLKALEIAAFEGAKSLR